MALNIPRKPDFSNTERPPDAVHTPLEAHRGLARTGLVTQSPRKKKDSHDEKQEEDRIRRGGPEIEGPELCKDLDGHGAAGVGVQKNG